MELAEIRRLAEKSQIIDEFQPIPPEYCVLTNLYEL